MEWRPTSIKTEVGHDFVVGSINDGRFGSSRLLGIQEKRQASDYRMGISPNNEPQDLPKPLSADVAYAHSSAQFWPKPILPGFSHLVPPAEQVLDSKDILPMILEHLKESIAPKWKKPFTSLMLVNSSFFWAGMAILWREMKSIAPALKLLPWYDGTQYQGLGKYHYTGKQQDWDRFSMYAPNIRHIKLETEPTLCETLEPHWVTELFFLPCRPSSLFPNIRSISVGPEAMPSLPAIQLLISSSLQSLDIAACSEYFPYDDDDYEEDIDQKVQTLFPLLHFYAPNIQTLHYRGPSENGIFQRLSMLKTITDLRLEWVDCVNACDLLPLRDLPLLQTLHLSTSEPVIPAPSIDRASPDGAPHSPALRTLKITGNEMLQLVLCMYQGVHPNLEDIYLELTRLDQPAFAQRALGFYFEFNPNLETIRVRVLPPDDQHSRWPASAAIQLPPEVSDLDIETRAKNAFQSSTNVKTATFESIPPSLWSFMSSSLQGSIHSWKRLTSLTFKIEPTSPEVPFPNDPRWVLGTTFPGLSFLANIVWPHCPSLEALEFQFDPIKLMKEDLSQVFKNLTSAGIASKYPGGHPLRSLRINTTTDQEDDDEDIGFPIFSPERKAEIVDLLDRFFPQLTDLTGTPSAIWREMGTWLQTYRILKERARSER